MTVKEAKAIVKAEYPDSIVGTARGTGWRVVKWYPFCSPIGPYANTDGEAWKKCAAAILSRAKL